MRSLLNDADIPSINIVSSSGAVRASNIVTITTQANHNLQVGNYVQLQNVIDSSFNGTFQIPIGGILSATSFQYGQTGANSTSGGGLVELIIQGDVFTDTVLLPLVNSAYRKVQARLGIAGSKTVTGTVELTMAVGMDRLDDSTSPQLPNDFMAPRVIQERITGNPYYGGDMREVDIIPSEPQQAYNRLWSWEDEGINFPGSFNELDVRIRYFKSVLNSLTDGTSQLLIRGCTDAVAYYTAYLASQSRGSTLTGSLKSVFEENISELKNQQAHARQYLPGKRRSYGRFGRNWGSGNWGAV